MLSAAAAAAKAHQEKRSAELKKLEGELRDRAKELDRQASKVRNCPVIACYGIVAIQINFALLVLADHGLLGFVSPHLWHFLWFVTHNILAEKETVHMHVCHGLIHLLPGFPQLPAIVCL